MLGFERSFASICRMENLRRAVGSSLTNEGCNSSEGNNGMESLPFKVELSLLASQKVSVSSSKWKIYEQKMAKLAAAVLRRHKIASEFHDVTQLHHTLHWYQAQKYQEISKKCKIFKIAKGQWRSSAYNFAKNKFFHQLPTVQSQLWMIFPALPELLYRCVLK